MQLLEEKQELDLPQTLARLNTDKKLSEGSDNLKLFIDNIVIYCKEVQAKQLDQELTNRLHDKLKEQCNVMLFEDKIQRFSDILAIEDQQGDAEPFEKKLYDLELIIRQLIDLKNNASSQEKYISYENQGNKYIQSLEFIINQQNIKSAIQKLEVFSEENLQDQKEGTSEIDIPSSHFFKEKINTKIDYSPKVFSNVRPLNHQFYVAESARIYHQIAAFKIKTISLSITEGPVISRPNFFEEGLDQSKAILHYCIPQSKKVAFYSMADVCKVHTISKEYYHERQLANQWLFSSDTKSVITPSGKIYAINCRNSKEKIDPYLYEITELKASNRGPLITPKRDAGLLYLNGSLYLIGGRGQGEKCSKKNYRYLIRQKKWVQLSESNVPLRKPTLCSLNNRYICKFGGLNEFDYINKIIQIYDTVTDKWALVRASPRNILEEIQILEDSLAVQINDDQVYVFGGKNANKFNTDTGFVLVISEIRQKKKGAPKVTGEFWNVSVGKRNILTFFGDFSSTTPLIQHNCIYGLRTSVTKAYSP